MNECTGTTPAQWSQKLGTLLCFSKAAASCHQQRPCKEKYSRRNKEWRVGAVCLSTSALSAQSLSAVKTRYSEIPWGLSFALLRVAKVQARVHEAGLTRTVKQCIQPVSAVKAAQQLNVERSRLQ